MAGGGSRAAQRREKKRQQQQQQQSAKSQPAKRRPQQEQQQQKKTKSRFDSDSDSDSDGDGHTRGAPVPLPSLEQGRVRDFEAEQRADAGKNTGSKRARAEQAQLATDQRKKRYRETKAEKIVWRKFDRENETFERYYQQFLQLEPDEWKQFVASLKDPVPVHVRVNGASYSLSPAARRVTDSSDSLLVCGGRWACRQLPQPERDRDGHARHGLQCAQHACQAAVGRRSTRRLLAGVVGRYRRQEEGDLEGASVT